MMAKRSRKFNQTVIKHLDRARMELERAHALVKVRDECGDITKQQARQDYDTIAEADRLVADAIAACRHLKIR